MRGLLLTSPLTPCTAFFFSTDHSTDIAPVKRFSPLAEDLHLGNERRVPVPIHLSIQALMEDKIDHPKAWKIDRISLIGLLVQFHST
jgi:hypothetical protein